MFVTSRFRVDPDDRIAFVAQAERAVAALVARPGCLLAQVGQAADEPELWALTTIWESVGAYRRALSDYQVKLDAVPLMYRAVDEPSAYVEVIRWRPGTEVEHSASPVADGGGRTGWVSPAEGRGAALGPVHGE